MKHKMEIIVGIGIVLCVVLTLAFYINNIGTLEIQEIGIPLIAMLLVVFAVYVLWDRFKNLKKGLPSKDERLTLISYKAGYYGFIAAIWSAVGAPLATGIIFDYELSGHYLTAIVVLVSGFSFIISYLYLSFQGK